MIIVGISESVVIKQEFSWAEDPKNFLLNDFVHLVIKPSASSWGGECWNLTNKMTIPMGFPV